MESERFNPGKLYPVLEKIPYLERMELGLSRLQGVPMPSLGAAAAGVHAKPTGEKRPPKKGEWYLSGSTIQAYRAPNDLDTAYHIAKLVRTEKETITIVREV